MTLVTNSPQFDFTIGARKHQDNSENWDSVFWFGSGREAIYATIRALEKIKGTVMLPAYVPEGVYAPFYDSDWDIQYYDLNADLSPDAKSIQAALELSCNVNFVVCIHYFGIISDLSEVSQLVKSHGAVMVEDMSHVLPNETLSYGDYGEIILYSLPKVIGVPDGALCQFKTEELLAAISKFETSSPKSWYLLQRIVILATANLTATSWCTPTVADKIGYVVGGVFNSYKSLMRNYRQPSRASAVAQYIYFRTDILKAGTRKQEAFLEYQKSICNENVGKPELENKTLLGGFGYPLVVRDVTKVIEKFKERNIKVTTLKNRWCFLQEDDYKYFPISIHFLRHHVILPTSEHLKKEQIFEIADIVNEEI